MNDYGSQSGKQVYTLKLARLLDQFKRQGQIAETWSNKIADTVGTITDVADPEKRGRVKVILDEVNPDVLSAKGIPQGGAPTVTDWINPYVPFQGTQPGALVGKRVPVGARNGDPNRLTFGDPLYDPDEAKSEQPKNTAMTRVPVYKTEEFPEPCEENRGCMAIEAVEKPWKRDILHICVNIQDQYVWVNLCGEISMPPVNKNPLPCDPGCMPQEGRDCQQFIGSIPPDSPCNPVGESNCESGESGGGEE